MFSVSCCVLSIEEDKGVDRIWVLWEIRGS